MVNQSDDIGSAPRTTNFCEGYHKRLLTVFQMSHPPLGYFIQTMRGEMLDYKDQCCRILRHFVEIKKRDRHVIASEERVINARNTLRDYLAANNNQIRFEV